MKSVLHKLETIRIEKIFISDVFNALMNTIIFHRALGPVYINYTNCQRLEKVTYMKCGDKNVDTDISEFINNILITNQKNEFEGQIKIHFMHEEKAAFWQLFSAKQKNDKVFETWTIPVRITNNLDENDEEAYNQQIKQTSDVVQKAIFQIINYCNLTMDHVDETYQNPSNKIVKYPYQLFWGESPSQSKKQEQEQEQQ